MMTKKDFKQLATALSSIEDDNKRNEVVELMCECCLKNNSRFDDNRFIEWIRRVRAGEDLKGLR